MKLDLEIQKDVMNELKWQPFLASSEIGVSVKNGIATLSGLVDSYAKKLSAEKAAKKVAGVKAVALDIQVGVSPAYRKTDTEIAEAALFALKWHAAVKEDKIKLKVEDGTITMEGEVEWGYQRTSAQYAVENLTGVRSVINLITVKPKVVATDIRQKINLALHRSATLDAERILVETSGSTVILRGKVRSFAEKSDAEKAAWAAPGVTDVENKLIIEISENVLA